MTALADAVRAGMQSVVVEARMAGRPADEIEHLENVGLADWFLAVVRSAASREIAVETIEELIAEADLEVLAEEIGQLCAWFLIFEEKVAAGSDE